MNQGQFRAQITRVEAIYKDLDLADLVNERVHYPADLAKSVRKRPYREEWEYYVRNQFYDLRLRDWSILQFKPETPVSELSFSFYECPVAILPYREFLVETLGSDVDNVGHEFWEEYEEYVYTSALRDAVTPIRYDLSPALYEEGIHPSAHIHIGHRSEIRLFTVRMLRPLSFGLLILRQVYPDAWRAFLKRPDAPSLCRQVRDALEIVPAEHHKPKDRLQMILT